MESIPTLDPIPALESIPPLESIPLWNRFHAIPIPVLLAITPIPVPVPEKSGIRTPLVFTKLSSRKVEGSCGRGRRTETNVEARRRLI